MTIQPGTWYKLPDGMRVFARDAGAGAVRLEDARGVPLYHCLPGASSLYHLILDPRLQVFHAAACDLTPDDLRPFEFEAER